MKGHDGLTTDPDDPDIGHGSDNAPVPQNKKYLVLSDEERAKGFVRPVRRTYQHRGRHVCGKPMPPEHVKPGEFFVCADAPGHAGECHHFTPVPDYQMRRFKARNLIGGCDTITSMGPAIAETYARDPKFYGSTYCTHCLMHRPVDEFVWEGTDEKVGS